MHVIAKTFANYFSAWNIELPAEALLTRRPGVITAAGWQIRYLFGSADEGDFLDFFASHRMTNSRHQRIYNTGRVENLPTYLEWIVYPPSATEAQKHEAKQQYYSYNAHVGDELRRKGFG